MLYVPYEITDLLHEDTCKKNIRIHFPNGERSDICNDLIVRDSVTFTESLCSRDSLKFGLCEASVFECEVVGVGNIKGAFIEVYCEVYCDMDVYGSVFRPDLMANVYPIPYGTFIVESCERQADLAHRRISAYGGTSVISETNDILAAIKEGLTSTPAAFEPDVFKMIMMTSNTTAPLADALMTEVETTSDNVFTIASIDTGWGDELYEVYAECVGFNADTNALQEKLYYIEKTNPDKSLSDIEILMGFTSDQYSVALDTQLKQTKWDCAALGGYGVLSFLRAYTKGSYFYLCQIESSTAIMIPYKFSYGRRYRWSSSPTIIGSYQFRDPDEQKIYSVDTSNYPSYKLYYPRVKVENSSLYKIENTSEMSFISIFNNMVELQGEFCNLNRENKLVFINIKRQFGLLPASSLYPGSGVYPQGVNGGKLLPQDYQSCWYDDNYSKCYGAVRCEYESATGANILVYYLSGYDASSNPETYLVYDISDNDIIKGSTWNPNDINAICATIARNIDKVSYIPVDFVGRGLPYVEAGDTFEILTRSNDSITTIVLNRTLTGEQVLTDSYKSV